MVNQLSPGFGVPSCRRVPELSSSCSITYKLPIFYPLCFDIHASDGGCGGYQSPVTGRQSPLCPTSYLSRGLASSVLLEPTFLSNKLATGPLFLLFSCLGGCDG